MSWRRLSQLLAAAIGILFGLHRFGQGLQAVFVMGDYTYTEFITLIAMGFTLFPLSILGIWRPRVAGYGLLLSALITTAGSAYLDFTWDPFGGTPRYKAELLAIMVIPLLLVGTLFLFGPVANPLGERRELGE